MTTAVVSDTAVTFGGKEEHLAFKVIGVERPAMREGDNLSGWVAPVLVEDGGLVFGSDEGHFVKSVVRCW